MKNFNLDAILEAMLKVSDEVRMGAAAATLAVSLIITVISSAKPRVGSTVKRSPATILPALAPSICNANTHSTGCPASRATCACRSSTSVMTARWNASVMRLTSTLARTSASRSRRRSVMSRQKTATPPSNSAVSCRNTGCADEGSSVPPGRYGSAEKPGPSGTIFNMNLCM